MDQFKVTFFMNHAISAEKVVPNGKLTPRLSFDKNKSFIEWLVVFAEDEIDAILSADDIFNEYLSMHVVRRN